MGVLKRTVKRVAKRIPLDLPFKNPRPLFRFTRRGKYAWHQRLVIQCTLALDFLREFEKDIAKVGIKRKRGREHIRNGWQRVITLFGEGPVEQAGEKKNRVWSSGKEKRNTPLGKALADMYKLIRSSGLHNNPKKPLTHEEVERNARLLRRIKNQIELVRDLNDNEMRPLRRI